jgi:crotonobetaine/carnitine-CoA ligase
MNEGTLNAIVRQSFETMGDRAFLEVLGAGTRTFAEIYESARRCAGAFRRFGVGRGDIVAIVCGNTFDGVHSWLGANLVGAAEATINPANRGASLEHALNTVRARVAVVEEPFLATLRDSESALPYLRTVLCSRRAGEDRTAELPRFERIEVLPLSEVMASSEPGPDAQPAVSDVASVIFTSGTTGPAKGVLMPHGQIHALASQTVRGLRLAETDTLYTFHPLFHMAGKFMGLLAMMMAGGRVALDGGFSATAWLDRVRETGATVGLAHGPMIEMVFGQPERPEDRDHRLSRVMAVPLPKRIGAAFESRFNVSAIEVWGMTEINVPAWRPFDESSRPGSCGKVDRAAYDLRIVDPETDEELPVGMPGEIVIRHLRPWTIMRGYLEAPDKTVEAWRNLWFHTGDVGYLDGEGYLYILDRLGDRIRRRAENISSYDIEAAAATHPDVAECAAIGVPSEFEADEDVKLFVVLRPDVAFAPEDLTRHLLRYLPHYMVPRYLEPVPALPRTMTNKIRKSELRAREPGPAAWDRKRAGLALRDFVPPETV